MLLQTGLLLRNKLISEIQVVKMDNPVRRILSHFNSEEPPRAVASRLYLGLQWEGVGALSFHCTFNISLSFDRKKNAAISIPY